MAFVGAAVGAGLGAAVGAGLPPTTREQRDSFPEVPTQGAMVQLHMPRKQHPLYRTMATEVGKRTTDDVQSQPRVGRTNFFSEQFRGGVRNDPLSKVFMPSDSTLTVGNRGSRFASAFDENGLHVTARTARDREFQRNNYGSDTVANMGISLY